MMWCRVEADAGRCYRCGAAYPASELQAVRLAALLGSVAGAQSAETSSGSGVVISTKGEVLTNAHAVEACQTITVKLATGNSQSGALVARDERNDLAVVRLTETKSPPTSVALFREGAPLRAGDAMLR
jgi:S1-C subfamily serine protease